MLTTAQLWPAGSSSWDGLKAIWVFFDGEGKAFGYCNLTMSYLGRHFSIPSPKLFTAEGDRLTVTQKVAGGLAQSRVESPQSFSLRVRVMQGIGY